ncbi:MAG: alkaline phosphatase D family protein, partial [Haliea sp.]
PLWDDHESTNNPWMGGAENHQPDQEGDWRTRRDVSLRAWYEWMPVREPGLAEDPAAYWRHFRFGDLASLVTLETRHTGRVRQVDYATEALAAMDPQSAQQFLRNVVGAPGREMLSTEMQDFAARALAESVSSQRHWRLIGNQVPMARMLAPRLDASDLAYLQTRVSEANLQRAKYFARLGELGLPLYLDPWDGYPWAREAFYQRCRAAGATDLVVLTGDSHSFWQNSLYDGEGRHMGVELGTTGISSPGDFLEFGTEGARLMDQRLIASNPEVLWTEGTRNGYLRLKITRDALQADFVSVSNILSRDYTTSLLRQVTLRCEGGSLTQAVTRDLTG